MENPLQLEYYNTLRAGEEFFTRLDALRERPRENRPLLELYYQSLALGFEGKYFEYKDELAQLFAQLSKELAGDRDWTMDSVSPHWHPPPQQPAAPPRKPWRLRVAIGAVAVLLVFGAFHLWGQRKAQDASQNIRDTYQGMN